MRQHDSELTVYKGKQSIKANRTTVESKNKINNNNKEDYIKILYIYKIMFEINWCHSHSQGLYGNVQTC